MRLLRTGAYSSVQTQEPPDTALTLPPPLLPLVGESLVQAPGAVRPAHWQSASQAFEYVIWQQRDAG